MLPPGPKMNAPEIRPPAVKSSSALSARNTGAPALPRVVSTRLEVPLEVSKIITSADKSYHRCAESPASV